VATIEDVIDRIAEWQGRSLAVSPLSGGLTNINYCVEVDGVPFVVRVPGENTGLLAINRQHEYYNTLAAQQAGIGARIVHYVPELSVMVLEFIPGPTMSPERLRQPGMIARIARSVRVLHGGPAFTNTFDMFRLMESYLTIVEEHQLTIPDGYRESVPIARRIEAAMAVRPVALVPCHNDLMAENVIDDGSRLRLVDYEYSGTNDPCFELGHICNEAEFDSEQGEALCAAYFGEATTARLARMRLYTIMANLGWTLWGCIQHGVSEIDFDFWDWTLTRWQRAQAAIASPGFGALLEDVKRDL
jgi:thiamine kinase-like enzyme